MEKAIFTHQLIKNFGWENTIYQVADFDTVEELGYNQIDGHIFLAFHRKIKYILKGFYSDIL